MINKTSKTTFTLKGMSDIFAPTDPERKKGAVQQLPLVQLTPFEKHPFAFYTGDRFEDMVKSIKENGVIIPIIVRPKEAEAYEILSGHNRVNAAKAAGYETVPAIVREGLTDEEAMLIVTETNLIQRSFTDLSHSERAVALLMHHESIKKQGRRTDLLEDIENMLSAVEDSNPKTSGALRQKSGSREMMANQYDLSGRTIAYYLRINRLIEAHRKRLDKGVMALRTAVTLSYLTDGEQQIIDEVMDSLQCGLDMKKADSLRVHSKNNALNHDNVRIILTGADNPKRKKPTGITLKPGIVAKYFKPDQKPKEIEEIIIKALELYYARG